MSQARAPRAARLLAGVALSLLILLAIAASASATPLRFGAFTPGDPYDGRVTGTEDLQRKLGRHVDIVLWYQNWGGGDWISSVQPHLIGAVARSGRIPLLTWEPWNTAGGVDQPRYSLSSLARGDFDGYIRSFALDLKATGSTVYLRPMHEMNGNWYPWAGTVNGNSPALYVQAWRRMHQIFRSAGAHNVRWVWSPYQADVPRTSGNRLEAYYPGAAYVDVLAVDGYNWGSTAPGNGGWQTFSQVFGSAYERLRRLGPQPIWIAEVGAAPEGGDKAAWVRDMFARAAAMDRLEAIVWFNENKERDWRAAPNAAVAAAFRPGAGVKTGTGDSARRVSQARLQLRLKRRIRAGRKMTVRWTATGADSVRKWHAYLNGRRVRVMAARRPPRLRKRIRRRGRQRWTLKGRDARGRTVVSASRTFIAYRRKR